MLMMLAYYTRLLYLLILLTINGLVEELAYSARKLNLCPF